MHPPVHPRAAKVLTLIPTDVGRPIGDLKSKLLLTDLEKIIREVIDSLVVQEREVRDSDGHWYLLAVRPYKTDDNKIDGAVVTLLDVDAIKTERAADPRKPGLRREHR